MKRSVLPLLFAAAVLRAADASSYWDIVLKARENAPAVQRAGAERESLSALDALARQRPNPDLEAEFSSRTDGDRAGMDGQAAYLHTFELGGKRRARRDVARAQLDLAAARLDLAREEATVRALLGLHRLRQLKDELASVSEALDTFKGITNRYRARPRLAPEQATALAIFRLAQGDQELRRVAHLREQREWESWFALAVGTVPMTLPPHPDSWPDLAAPPTGALGGARRREADAETALARAEAAQARSDSWPDATLGPLAALETGRGQNARGLGASASLPLPLYQRNAGGRALAQAGLRRAESLQALSEKEWATALSSARQDYAQAVEALRHLPPMAEMTRSHANMEALFERGLLDPGLVIEAHRQMSDALHDGHETELEALRALWTVRALTGTALEDRP
jgi:cobalt-zinc-cadmium efflux system outer membrane protein